MSGLTTIEAGLVEGLESQSILERTIEWANINSGTGNLEGLSRMADVLGQAFAALPGEVRLVDADPVELVRADGAVREVRHGQHLLVRVRPDAPRRVILTGHMDTVYGADDAFQSCDWIDERTLHGPGTADMKGGIALMLAGLQAFESGAPELGYDVLINSDEETGSASSARLIAELAQGKIAALTYEPPLPSGNMARARPGSGNFSAVIRGRSAHAGRNPEEGRNAILAASDLALRLAALVEPGLTLNPAKIDGGGPNNLVPALGILRFNMRPHSPEQMERALARIDALIAEVARTHDVAIHLHGQMGRPPKPITPQTERLFALVRQASLDLGQPMEWQDTGGVCDGNNIAACGVPVLDTMGAPGGAIHSPDEFLRADLLAPRAALTALVMHRLDGHKEAP
ncbi:MAG: hydrolase [Sphingobium sp.]|jgi:glutamate carboxypeptidase|nr:hydrolase [Sphingobium sp.]MCI1757358.1 hydrolase [Sphingobium sp.]